MRGTIDLIKDIVNPKMTTRYKIARTLGRIAFMRNFLSKKLGNQHGFLVENPIECANVKFEKSEREFLEALERDGFSTGINLSIESVEEIIDFCNKSLFDVNRNPNKKIKVNFEDTEQKDGYIFSLNDPHLSNKLIYNIATDKRVLRIVTGYLGVSPVLYGTQIWYTFPDDSKQHHYDFGFHYDIDDIKFIKLFFYLDDVSIDHGPHMIIKRTHNSSHFFKIFNRQISDKLAEEKYGENITIMTARQGEGFFEDTFNYHKGGYPTRRRLILQFEYTVSTVKQLKLN